MSPEISFPNRIFAWSPLFLVAMQGISYSGERDESPVTLIDAAYHQSDKLKYGDVSLLGLEFKANGYISLYSAHKVVSLYFDEERSEVSAGVLSSSLTLLSILALGIPWGTDSKPLAITGVAAHVPALALNPEVRLFPYFPLNPYFGYAFDLTSSEAFNPVLFLKEGILFRFGKGHILKLEVHQRLFKMESNLEVGIALQTFPLE